MKSARATSVDMRSSTRTRADAMCILNDCRHVHLRDISIVHSPLWNVALMSCDRVTVHGVYTPTSKGVNADGIDIVSSRNVTISDSMHRTATMRSCSKPITRQQRLRPVERHRHQLRPDPSSHCADDRDGDQADIRHVLLNDCVIRNSNRIGINVHDGAVVSDVIVAT